MKNNEIGFAMIDFDEYIESRAYGDPAIVLPHGRESAKVIRVREWVYKLRCINISQERFALHNKYFGDSTGYEILGCAQSCDVKGVLLKQPYIDMVPQSNDSGQKLMAEDFLNKYGRVLVVKDEMWCNGCLFDNLNDGNVGVNSQNGKYAVVDCLIGEICEKSVKDMWDRCGYSIKELKV